MQPVVVHMRVVQQLWLGRVRRAQERPRRPFLGQRRRLHPPDHRDLGLEPLRAGGASLLSRDDEIAIFSNVETLRGIHGESCPTAPPALPLQV